MIYTKDQMLDLIEEAVTECPAGKFPSVEAALEVVGSALNYLIGKCEDVNNPSG
jgi:hypothetical protein